MIWADNEVRSLKSEDGYNMITYFPKLTDTEGTVRLMSSADV